MATAAETFTGPDLADLITQAEHGRNVNKAIANRMLQALQSQLEAGPLADLTSGAVTPDSPVAEAQALEASFEQDVARQLMGKSATRAGRMLARLGQVLNLDGRRVVAELVSLEAQDTAFLINNDEFGAAVRAAIGSLTAGPIRPLGTSLAGMASTTSAAVARLEDLSKALAGGAFTSRSSPAHLTTSPPTAAEIEAEAEADRLAVAAGLQRTTLTVDAELEAYRASVQAATRVGQPGVAAKADAAIRKLEDVVDRLNPDDFDAALAQLNSGIAAFDAALLGKAGVFGPRGPYSRAPKAVNLRPNSNANLAPSSVTKVSGTASPASSTGGGATLTATLSGADGSAIAGQRVNFTIDGFYVGAAVTDAAGVATLGGLTTSGVAGGSRSNHGVTINYNGVAILAGNTLTSIQNFGTDVGAIVATFGGNTRYLSGQGRGDLVVTPTNAT